MTIMIIRIDFANEIIVNIKMYEFNYYKMCYFKF